MMSLVPIHFFIRRIFYKKSFKTKIYIRSVYATTCDTNNGDNGSLSSMANNPLDYQKHLENMAFLRVTGSGYFGSSRSVQLITGEKRYMFNCGEGNERKDKYRIEKEGGHIFITYNNWENIGGLISLSLKWQSRGMSRILLHGPPRLEEIFRISEGFIDPPWRIQFEKSEYCKKLFEDNTIRIEYVPLFNSCGNDNGNNIRKDGENDEVLSEENSRNVSLAYICKLRRDNNFHFGESIISNEEATVLEEGTTLNVDSIKPKKDFSAIFFVVECPSEAFLDSLLEAKEFMPFLASSSTSHINNVDIIVHFTPESIMNHPKYKEWMHRFPIHTCHILVNDLSGGYSSSSISNFQHVFHLLHSEIFPILRYEEECSSNFKSSSNFNFNVPNLVLGKPKLQYILSPEFQEIRKYLSETNFHHFVNNIMKIPGFSEKLTELRETWEKLKNLNETYPEITFLGTGASGSAVFRNAAGILITLSSQSYILLDCGDGTYDQLLRLYGVDATHNILKNLKAIFISHLHPDHHLGLIRILLQRKKLFNSEEENKLLLMAPAQINDWLLPYHEIFEEVLNTFKFISNSTLENNETKFANEEYKMVQSNIGLKELTTVRVLHWCDPSFGIVLTLNDGKKLVYSGDSMPCDDLIAAGKDCDVLIHEATFEDKLAALAERTMHSTTSEAIEVGRKMGAKFTLLTHFSQRYPLIPLLNDNIDNFVGIAFDNMKLSWKNIHLTSYLNSTFMLMFNGEQKRLRCRYKWTRASAKRK